MILATIIDNFWLVTSKKCCANKESFKVVYDDKDKSRWLFSAKRRVRGCVRGRFCSKMWPRTDTDTDICLLELTEDIIENGKLNNVMLRTICLPESESLPGSSCFTSGINQDRGSNINRLNSEKFQFLRLNCHFQGKNNSQNESGFPHK